MARTNDPHSATSQFFINNKDNPSLDYVNESRPGYCVFGKVIAGQEVVDKISKVETGMKNGMRDVPVEVIVITKASRLNAEKSTKKEKKSE
jgi:cyclophilin family peptidyl-prolyl cis-trans isomerase